MSVFTGDLVLIHQPKKVWEWKLGQEIQYEVGAEGSGRWVIVPAGFETDGATVPRLLWAILPSWGTYSRAAVVHDYLLVCIKKGQPHPEAPTRKDADLIFLEAMEVCGTHYVVRHTMFGAVRLNSIFKESGLYNARSSRPVRDLHPPVPDISAQGQTGAESEGAAQPPSKGAASSLPRSSSGDTSVPRE